MAPGFQVGPAFVQAGGLVAGLVEFSGELQAGHPLGKNKPDGLSPARFKGNWENATGYA